MTKHNTNPKTRKTRATSRSIGIDLGDRFSELCVLDGEGALVSQARLRTTRAALQEYFGAQTPARVALETGTHSGWVSRIAAVCGHEVIVANAREVRKIHQSNRKNDRADAEILARMVRFDPQLLAPIVHRSEQMQIDISLIRARDALVSARTKLINAARGLTKALGGRLPRCTSPCFAQRVREQMPEELASTLAPLVAAVDALTEQIRSCDQRVETVAQERYPETALLQQITGVGTLTSLAFVLTLFDKGRFARSRDSGLEARGCAAGADRVTHCSLASRRLGLAAASQLRSRRLTRCGLGSRRLRSLKAWPIGAAGGGGSVLLGLTLIPRRCATGIEEGASNGLPPDPIASLPASRKSR